MFFADLPIFIYARIQGRHLFKLCKLSTPLHTPESAFYKLLKLWKLKALLAKP
jgi:hypothetical protein